MKTRRKIIRQSQKKKKIIPLHFQKKRPASLSQILKTAKHQRQVKELMKNNRILAKALEESQCIGASNNMLLQEYARENNQIMLAKMKLNEMAETIQKLVVDLNNVVKYLDVSYLSTSRRPFDGIRVISRQPDLEAIDESMVSVENSTVEESSFSHEEASTHTETPTELQSLADSSLTEVYNVQQLMKNFSAHGKDSRPFEKIANISASESLTPPTPELNLPLFVSKVTAGNPDNSSSSLFENGAKQVNYLTSPKNTITSKIPVRRPCLFPETCDRLDSPVSLKQENRRETFVVVKESDNNQNMPSASLRRTFTLNELITELSPSRNLERRGTFIVPNFQQAKPPQSTVHQQTSFNLCPEENTIHMSEDMDLTEILPSSVSTLANSLFNRDIHAYSENSYLPFVNRNKEILKTGFQKSTVKINEQISPIAKVSAKSELKKDNKSEKVTNAKNSHLTKTAIPSKDIKETKEFLQTGNSPSKKLCRQQVLQLDNMPQSSSDAESSLDLAMDKKIVECLNVIPSKSPQKNLDTVPNIRRRTSILPNASAKTAENILTNPISADPEQDFVEPPRKSIKKMSTRKSLKPNNKLSLEFKSNVQNSNSDNAEGYEKVESLQADADKYEFSSSESDDETAKKSKLSKNVSKKNGSKALKLKEKSTVASLERDINLMYQNHSRKKRSMKRRVSFANTNISPDNSDVENENKSNENTTSTEITRYSLNLNKVENNMESSENLISLPENRIPAPRRSILKKSQPPVSFENTNISPDDSDVENKSNENTTSNEMTRYSLNLNKVENNMESSENLVSLPENRILAPRRSILKKSQPPVSFENTNISPDDIDVENKSNENSTSEIKGYSLNPNKIENNVESSENLVSLPENRILAPRRSILKKSQPRVNEKRCSFVSDVSKVPLNDVQEQQQNELLDSIRSPEAQEKLPKKSNKSAKLLMENNDELFATDIASQKHSEIFGEKVYLRSESKRTFSGVSERASKKRFTADDDFLDAAELDLSGKTDNLQMEQKGEIASEELKVSRNTKTPKLKKKSNKNSVVPSKKSKGKKISKSKRSTEIEEVVSREPSIDCPLFENKQFCTPSQSKLNSSSTGSSISQKENIIVSESGGRSRRVRPQKSFKEPALNSKMRR